MSPDNDRNPFRPGAGHMPPYLAGRATETAVFQRLLTQDVVLENLVLTGLRGVGKTVLLDTLKLVAIKENWLWVGTDMSEATSISEERIAIRLMADLAVVTSSIVVDVRDQLGIGFHAPKEVVNQTLSYDLMTAIYDHEPGLVSDKIKQVLEFVWAHLKAQNYRGVVFAYDEAQNLTDHSAKEEFPLSLLLDVFQSIQKKGIPFMLALTGLPTLFPKLVEARTFAERMFHMVFLNRLSEQASREAIEQPMKLVHKTLLLSPQWIDVIIEHSGGYPYFLQFMGREMFDVALQTRNAGKTQNLAVPINDIIRKLDTDFFSGRWARATERQRELLSVIAQLDDCDGEFTVQDIATKSKSLSIATFSPSHVNQILVKLCDAGLVYKNRHGRYSFAVPLLGRFILRQISA